MLTNEDIIKLSEVLATKEDVKEIRADVDSLRESVQGLTISVDKLVKFMTDSKEGEMMAKNKFDRYEKWFNLIAEKLGIKLEY